MDLMKSFSYLNKQNNKEFLLKEVSTSFSIFNPKYLVMTKEVDRPDDFYYLDDDITFIITLENIGDKNITDFTLKDDTPSLLNPTESGFYEVLTPLGDISFEENYLLIEHLNIPPKTKIEILISGKVKSQIDDDEMIMF